jgi:hypothetical protein
MKTLHVVHFYSKESCSNHLRWLKSQYYKYQIIYFGTSPMVPYPGYNSYQIKYYELTDQEDRFQERLIPLWLISSNSPNKDCILYQLPREISRYIIEQFI